MIALNRFKAGYAGQDEFAAAAETGEEVGRNPVDDDDLVGVDDMFIQLQRCAQLGRAAVDEGRVHTVMLIGLDAVDDFLTADGDVFFRRLGPVGSLRKDDVDVVVGNPGQVQFIDDVDEELVGMIPRACNIGDDQADFITGLYLFGQGGAADGVAHAVHRRFFYVDGGDVLSFHDVGNMFFRQFDGLCRFTNTESKFF